MTTSLPESELLRERLRRLALFGLLGHFHEVAKEPWLPRLIEYEEQERAHRSLERRLKSARLGAFKPIVDFDWAALRQVDRAQVEELFTLKFVEEGQNAILLGPNGVGKTTLALNLSHQAVVRGHTVRFTTASDMLNDLAARDSDRSLARRLLRYCGPRLLCIDEVGYLSYDARYADLLFEVVTRRYNDRRSIVLTTNKAFAQWTEVFPNSGCVVTLVDRLIHRSELITLDGDSYRLREAKQRAQERANARRGRKAVASERPAQRRSP